MKWGKERPRSLEREESSWDGRGQEGKGWAGPAPTLLAASRTAPVHTHPTPRAPQEAGWGSQGPRGLWGTRLAKTRGKRFSGTGEPGRDSTLTAGRGIAASPNGELVLSGGGGQGAGGSERKRNHRRAESRKSAPCAPATLSSAPEVTQDEGWNGGSLGRSFRPSHGRKRGSSGDPERGQEGDMRGAVSLTSGRQLKPHWLLPTWMGPTSHCAPPTPHPSLSGMQCVSEA